MEIKKFVTGPIENNVFLLIGGNRREAIIIDPGFESESVLNFITKRKIELIYIINTHGHIDHIFCNNYFKKQTGARIVFPEAERDFLKTVYNQAQFFGIRNMDPIVPDIFVNEGDIIEVDDWKIRFILTPGHTPGGMCLITDKGVFVGDTIFAGSIGRTDLPGGSYTTLIKSIKEKILCMPDDTILFPGHGPETKVGWERMHNPFLNDDTIIIPEF